MVIKHDGHLKIRGKCEKHELAQASVFYIASEFSNVRSVLSQCNTRLRLLHLLYEIEVMWRKTRLLCFIRDKTWVFDQSERTQGPFYVIINTEVEVASGGYIQRREAR